MCSISNHNSEFLLGLLLEENKHLNPIDFIDKTDRSSGFSCVCISLAIVEKYNEIQKSFVDPNSFFEIYFPLYANGLDNYRSIVGQSLRQVYIDEAKIFHQLEFDTFTTNNLVAEPIKKNSAMELLDTIRDNNSWGIILRDEIAFVIIHHDKDDFILIDPHVEYSGILSKASIYRYVVYDNVWNFDVHVLVPKMMKKEICDEPNMVNNLNQLDIVGENLGPLDAIVGENLGPLDAIVLTEDPDAQTCILSHNEEEYL